MKEFIEKYNLVSAHVGGGLEHWSYEDKENNKTYSISSSERDCPDLDTYKKDEMCSFTSWKSENFLGIWNEEDYESFDDTFENGLKKIINGRHIWYKREVK